MASERTSGVRCWFVTPAHLVASAVARLPQSGLLALGRLATVLLWPLLGKRRRYAATNLALCFPELDERTRTRLVRATVRATVTGVFELIRGWYAPARALRGLAAVEGLEHVRAAQAQGRGILLLSGHFLTLEICGRLLCRHVELAGFYRRHEQPALEWAVKRGRARYATAMFAREELRAAVRHVKQGGMLWYAPDQDIRGKESVFAPFFGISASSFAATHNLARLSGDDDVDLLRAIAVGQPGDDLPKRRRMREKRRDVAKENARLGKVGHVADVVFEVHRFGHGVLS